MVNSASFPRFVKVVGEKGGGGGGGALKLKFEGAVPHAVALYLPGDFFLTLSVAV